MGKIGRKYHHKQAKSKKERKFMKSNPQRLPGFVCCAKVIMVMTGAVSMKLKYMENLKLIDYETGR
jgi:hypothetical protein